MTANGLSFPGCKCPLESDQYQNQLQKQQRVYRACLNWPRVFWHWLAAAQSQRSGMFAVLFVSSSPWLGKLATIAQSRRSHDHTAGLVLQFGSVGVSQTVQRTA